MGVVIEGVNVVIRNAAVAAAGRGVGSRSLSDGVLTERFGTDGEICRIGFTSTADAKAYIETLERLGFLGPTPEGSREEKLAPQELRPASISPATGWKWAGSNSATGSRRRLLRVHGQSCPARGATALEARDICQMPTKELRGLEFLGTNEGVDVFHDKATGEIVYVGRTQKGAPPAHLSSAMVQERFCCWPMS